jgi:hypothetical protein
MAVFNVDARGYVRAHSYGDRTARNPRNPSSHSPCGTLILPKNSKVPDFVRRIKHFLDNPVLIQWMVERFPSERSQFAWLFRKIPAAGPFLNRDWSKIYVLLAHLWRRSWDLIGARSALPLVLSGTRYPSRENVNTRSVRDGQSEKPAQTLLLFTVFLGWSRFFNSRLEQHLASPGNFLVRFVLRFGHSLLIL